MSITLTVLRLIAVPILLLYRQYSLNYLIIIVAMDTLWYFNTSSICSTYWNKYKEYDALLYLISGLKMYKGGFIVSIETHLIPRDVNTARFYQINKYTTCFIKYLHKMLVGRQSSVLFYFNVWFSYILII